jgi:cytosine deaminase
MHSMDNYYVSKLIPLIKEAGVGVIANPLVNIVIQGRHDTYPKRRGLTRVPELLAAGIDVAFGQDCTMDPWYSLGSGDMLDVAHLGLHVAQMTSVEGMRAAFQAITQTPARLLGLDGYGLAPGCHGDFVLLDASDPIEAIRLRATRLAVVRRGRIISRTPAARAELNLPDRPTHTDFRL